MWRTNNKLFVKKGKQEKVCSAQLAHPLRLLYDLLKTWEIKIRHAQSAQIVF